MTEFQRALLATISAALRYAAHPPSVKDPHDPVCPSVSGGGSGEGYLRRAADQP